MAAISNVRANGTLRRDADNDDVVKVLKGNMGWHADSTYMPVMAQGAVFSAEVVPQTGGRTCFADMRAAYDALDNATRALVHQRSARHSLVYSQSKLGHVQQAGSAYNGYMNQQTGAGIRLLGGPLPTQASTDSANSLREKRQSALSVAMLTSDQAPTISTAPSAATGT